MSTKNVTLRLKQDLLRRCRHLAVEEDKSLSEWMTGILEHVVNEKESYTKARQGAMKLLKKGLSLGGKPLSRDEIYDR